MSEPNQICVKREHKKLVYCAKPCSYLQNPTRKKTQIAQQLQTPVCDSDFVASLLVSSVLTFTLRVFADEVLFNQRSPNQLAVKMS